MGDSSLCYHTRCEIVEVRQYNLRSLIRGLVHEGFRISEEACDIHCLKQLYTEKRAQKIDWHQIYIKNAENDRHTNPAQNISLGHQACLGGRGTSEGIGEDSGTLGLATTVEKVMDGTDIAPREVLAVLGDVAEDVVDPRANTVPWTSSPKVTSDIVNMCSDERRTREVQN